MTEDIFFFGVGSDEENAGLPDRICINDKPEPLAETGEKKDSLMLDIGEQVDNSDDLLSLQRSFFHQMHSYIDGLPHLIGVGPLVQAMSVHFLAAQIEKGIGKNKITSDKWDFYEIKVSNRTEFDHLYAKAVRQGRALNNLPEMVLLGFVSQFDAFMGRLLRICLDKKPHLIAESQKNFAAHEVLNYESIEDFREAVIEKEIETFLRLSHDEQFDWLEKAFKVKLRKDLPNWPKFIETFERRNLFAHSRGVVSQQYRIKCLAAGGKEPAAKGTKLDVNPSYLGSRLRIFLEIGVKLTQVLSRLLDDSEDNIQNCDSLLNYLGYELITHGHYGLASDLLKFAISCPKHPDDVLLRMLVVNCANSLRLAGKTDESDELLDRYQWNASSIEFRISVAAIRCDVETVSKLIPKFAPEGMPPQKALREWPVFAHVRTEEAFRSAYYENFSEDYVEIFDVKISASAPELSIGVEQIEGGDETVH